MVRRSEHSEGDGRAALPSSRSWAVEFSTFPCWSPIALRVLWRNCGIGTLRRPLDGPGVAGEGELADDGVVAGPVEGHLTAGQQQPQRNRQIKTVGVLLEIGRSEVAKRTSCGACSTGFWLPDRMHATSGVGTKDPGPIPVREGIQVDFLDALQGVGCDDCGHYAG